MDRRSFLRGSMAGAAIAVVGPGPDRVTQLSREIDEIDVDSYMTSVEHRELADHLLGKAGLAPGDGLHMRRDGDVWTITALDRNKYGKHFLRDGGFAEYEVSVRA